MAKAGRGSEQVMIRLPDGMRDRIRSAAEANGRSMNTEIVRALELAFPEPISLSQRLDELRHLFSALRKVRGYGAAIDAIAGEIVDVVEAGASGRDPTLDEETMAELYKALVMWKGRKGIEKAVRERNVDEKYKSTGENE